MTGISDFGTTGSSTTPSSSGASGVPGAAPASSSYNKSSMEKSLEAIAEEMIALTMQASMPSLPPPQETAKNDGVAGVNDSKAISAFLNSWISNLAIQGEQARKDSVKKDQVAHDRLVEDIKSDEIRKEIRKEDEAKAANASFATSYNQWILHPYANGVVGTGGYPDASFIAGSVLSSAGIVATAIGKDSNVLGVQLSVSPVADAIAAGGSMSGLPGDVQAAAAMIAALLYNGGINKANEETIKVTPPGGVPQTLEFSMNFAKQVKRIVNSNVPNSPQNNLIRLTLAAMALNLLYRQAYGGGGKEGMSGMDMKSLLNGDDISDIPDPAVREMVGELIRMVLKYLPKDTGSRNSAIDNLADQVDSKESSESMLETTNLFAGLMNVKGIDTSRMSSDHT